jgi:hypothetical protein
VDDDVGEINRTPPKPLSLEHRRGHRYRDVQTSAFEGHVREAAHEADLVLVFLAALVGGLNDELGLDPESPPDLVGHGS